MDIPYPQFGAVAAASAEFFGGLALVIGIWTGAAAVPLVITMAVAIFVVHRNAFSLQNNGMEYALTLGVVTLGLGLTGPGRFSLKWLFRLRDTVVDSEL